MSDALPLPPRPDLDQYRKLARDLQHACQAGDAAVRAWSVRWLETLSRLQSPDGTPRAARLDAARESDRMEQRWRTFRQANERRAQCLLADAQFFVAREHGFDSWPKFATHVETLPHPDSEVAIFEAAADAVVAGDAATLRRLLRDHPRLVSARSTREHRSTLLHYVSANGVEDFRQQTPSNIVEITRILLRAGADVNATSEAYGGGSTALGLAATSLHPQRAGVQIALLETLLEHGAKVEQGAAADDGSAVTGCLANGQLEAASYLVSRGALLTLEGAAGIGRLDVVRTFFDDRGLLRHGATRAQLERGFLYACGYGHLDVVRFLLERGVEPDVRNEGGESGLHWTSFGPYPAIARLLLERGATVNLRDKRYQSTPLDWTLFAWAKAEGPEREGGYELAALLVGAGAMVHIPWLEQNAGDQAQRDPRMQEILRDAITATPPQIGS
jgi:ankyrin repeat protein